MGKSVAVVAPPPPHSTKHAGVKPDTGDGDEGWRVDLLRGLVRGDLELVTRSLEDHIDVLSLPFTKPMPSWKVQWESIHWWMLRECTPLCVAAAYAHPDLVHALLLRGADRSSPCYLGRPPLDWVGECCTPGATVAEQAAACRRLLTAAPALPSPPMDRVAFSCNVATQVVVVPSSPSSSSSSRGQSKAATASSTQQTIYKCLVGVAWDAPLSNGALIDKYEVRYRQLADENGGDDSSSGWRVERAGHNRKTRQQGIALDGLQFDTAYEFMLRSGNAAGKGDWGRAYQFRTVASPDAAS